MTYSLGKVYLFIVILLELLPLCGLILLAPLRCFPFSGDDTPRQAAAETGEKRKERNG